MSRDGRDRVDEINSFLDAFSLDEVKSALKRRNARAREGRLAEDWKPWTGEGAPPRPYEWREVNGQIQYREPPRWEKQPPAARSETSERAQGKAARTEEALTPLTCPACAAPMYKEGVCGSCEDGRKGYRIRLLCGECDRVVLL